MTPEAKAADALSTTVAMNVDCYDQCLIECGDEDNCVTAIEKIIIRANAEYYLPLLRSIANMNIPHNPDYCGCEFCQVNDEIYRLEEGQK